MIVIIDNYDSFTYNIVQTIAGNLRAEGLTEEIRVYRNDKITVEAIAAAVPPQAADLPGPCTPEEAGISIAAIRYFSRQDAGIRGLPRASVHGRGFWRRNHTGCADYAWQDQPHAP